MQKLLKEQQPMSELWLSTENIRFVFFCFHRYKHCFAHLYLFHANYVGEHIFRTQPSADELLQAAICMKELFAAQAQFIVLGHCHMLIHPIVVFKRFHVQKKPVGVPSQCARLGFCTFHRPAPTNWSNFQVFDPTRQIN